MVKRITVNLNPAFCILLALMLLILPLKWLLAAISAALFHEICHIAAVSLCNGSIQKLDLRSGGAKLEISPLSYGQELICALAGPLGGLFLLLFARWLPRIAVCAALQSLYNLLPIHPLDGGRALRCGATLFMTESHARSFCAVVEKICLSAIILVSVYAAAILKLGISALFPAALILIHTKCGKIPCKRSPQRVQ